MAFDDIRFPDSISYGSSGSPSYRTDVIVLGNKHELRAALDDFPTYVYDVAFGVKTKAQMLEVHTFLHGRKGMARTFRFKDWFDYQAFDSPVVVTGASTIQLTKQYVSGPTVLNREIHKPTEDFVPFSMRRNGVAFVGFSLDLNTGIITLTPDSTSSIASSSAIAITGITNAAPGVVTTSVPHGLTTGEQVRISSVIGMTEINSIDLNVTVLTATTFETGVDTTLFSVYSSGGNVTQVGVSRQSPTMVRSVAHGLTTSDTIFIKNVSGMVEVNDQAYVVTVIDVDHFTIPIDSTNFSLYTSGGSVEFHVQPSETLDWTGEFDVRCRFGSDVLPATHEAFDIGNVGPIPMFEALND